MTTRTTRVAPLCAIALMSCSRGTERVDIDAFINDAPLARGCSEYPIVWEPQGRRTLVETSLQALDPESDLIWNTARDTPFSMEMDVRIPQCSRDREPLRRAVWDFMESHPGVFLVDEDDWDIGELDSLCGDIVEDRIRILSFSRHSIGPLPVQRGTLSVTVVRVDGRVHLQQYTGTHVPVATPDLIDALQDCPSWTDDELRAVVTSEPLPWQECNDGDENTFITHPEDALTLDGPDAWAWSEANGALSFERIVEATYRVSRERWEDGMVGSDAYCAEDEDIQPGVGWRLGLDTVLPAVSWALPGMGCTTCD